MKRNLLLTPGPTQTPPELCAALGKPIIHHRTPQFQENLKEVLEGLRYVCQTKNDVYILTSSGTGAMEAAVCNLLSPKDKAICVEGGKFGERWTELCNAYSIDTKVIKVAWGRVVQAHEVKRLLDEHKDIKAVFITLAETSTGVTTDVKAIAEVVKNTDAVLVVDAVSGLGVVDIQTDNWGVDMLCSASHKGLMLPPGIAFVTASSKAIALINKSKSPRYYFDLRESKKAMEKTDTPYTPAIGIVIAMVESLRYVRKMGLENLFASYARLAKGTQAAAVGLGLSVFPHESCRSNVLTAINLPASIDGEKLVKTMRDTYGISVAGGQDQLKGKVIRIAHMGIIDEYDILTGIACLEKVLHKMGHKFELGAGIAAAQKVFNQ